MGKTGMTFYAKSDILRDEVVEGNKLPPYSRDDYAKNPHFVKNGKWVLEGVSGSLSYHQRFVGAYKGLERIVLEAFGSRDSVLWVGDEPFGLLQWDKDDHTQLPTGGITLVSARQIHNGQLGQLAPIPKLVRVRELSDVPPASHKEPAWSRVSDLVGLSGLSFAQIVERFWPFVNRDYRPSERFPMVLKMVHGVTAEDIRARRPRVTELTNEELLDMLQRNPSFYDNDWLPASLGRTILRLITLGYEPIESGIV